MEVAKLAHRYEIHWLVNICEHKMIKWDDIPLIERLLFADRYGLKELKVAFTSTIIIWSEKM